MACSPWEHSVYYRVYVSHTRPNLLGKFRVCIRVSRYIPTRVAMIDRKPDVHDSRVTAERILYYDYYISAALGTLLGVLAEFFFLFVS